VVEKLKGGVRLPVDAYDRALQHRSLLDTF
jgi:hypothetical protein